MNIRTANISDIEKILILEEQVFKLHYSARPDLIDKEKSPNSYEFLRKYIESDNGKIFIAEIDEKIIRHCIINIKEIKNHHIYFDMMNIEIDDMCIDEKHRKKGIGKKLFEEVIKFSKEKGIKRLELGVWEFNENAIKFYESLGMKTKYRRMELEI